jgi:hypothetical protein
MGSYPHRLALVQQQILKHTRDPLSPPPNENASSQLARESQGDMVNDQMPEARLTSGWLVSSSSGQNLKAAVNKASTNHCLWAGDLNGHTIPQRPRPGNLPAL